MSQLHMDVSYSNHDIEAHFHHASSTASSSSGMQCQLIEVKEELKQIRVDLGGSSDTEADDEPESEAEETDPQHVELKMMITNHPQSTCRRLIVEIRRVCDDLQQELHSRIRLNNRLIDEKRNLREMYNKLLSEYEKPMHSMRDLNRILAIEASRLSLKRQEIHPTDVSASPADTNVPPADTNVSPSFQIGFGPSSQRSSTRRSGIYSRRS